jgi:asparagine synthase (glutamine-hydrolysing)
LSIQASRASYYPSDFQIQHMCGIAGIVAANGGVVDTVSLQRMNDLLAHRGPDGQGFMLATGTPGQMQHSFVPRTDAWRNESPVRVGLAHRRLAILDLSERGLQPMQTPDKRRWIVFNGEIYNHREIRSVLEAKGYVFTTRTDTEVLLNAYVEWGEDCLAELDGMFAFALWDDIAGRLFCVRDRLGIKPFYYLSAPGSFVFASEIKALTASPHFNATADDEAAVGFLIHGNCDYGERTIFRGVKALPPAHSLWVDGNSGRTSLRRYWTPAV